MKMILKIARKELQLLFYSPVAWVLLVLFVVQAGMMFTGKYAGYLKDIEYEDGVHYAVSTMLFIMGGLWMMVSGYLYYYIPLLTMGLVSRELSSGSIKLLYSSPLTNSQIILGKFAAMVIYALVMCLLLLLFVLVAGCTVVHFEWAAVLTGLFGLFLLTCTYAAVGIFISSLTTYQFVAAVGTFLSLMFLSYVGTWWQEYDLVRDITYWLSINGRVSTFIWGMICSEDLLYFPLVTALFLSLTVIRLNAIRQKVPFMKTLGRNLTVILAACFIGYLSSRPSLMAYYDASSTKWNTLTKESQDIVSKLEGDLTITGYANVLSGSYGAVGFPYFIQRNRELFKRYERFKPEMKLKMVYYYDTITVAEGEKVSEYFAKACAKDPGLTLWERAKKKCELIKLDSMMLKSPEEIRKKVDLTGERTFVWHVKRENGDSAWLRIFNDMFIYPSEAEISAMFKRMIMPLPKVGFIQGHETREILDYSPRGYSKLGGEKSFRESLLNQGFDAVEIDLAKGVPTDVNILTIADLRHPFNEREQEALKAYVERGGNLFILGEPRRREAMNPFLRELLGVEIGEGTLVQYRQDELAPDILVAVMTPEAKKMSYHFSYLPRVVLPTTAEIVRVEDKGFEMWPILESDTLIEEVWKRTPGNHQVWNELGSLNYQDERLVFNPEEGEESRGFYPAVGLKRMVNGKEQRVIITGDADCISNGELEQDRSRGNLYMILGSFRYLSNNEMPVDVNRPRTKDTHIHLNRLGYDILHAGFMYVLPLLLLGTGLFLWFRRRGR